MTEGFVFDIQRFSVHDGPGIRTTVFLGGCPLKCRWCHNPEGMTITPKLRFDRSRCIMCGKCAEVCLLHGMSEGNHVIKRDGCKACGKCTDVCPSGAVSLTGETMGAEAVLKEVLRDLPFYGSDGGVTFSGGEPLTQPDFVCECMKLCKKHGITTAADTCGYVPRESFDKVLPYTDYFLYDIKAVTESVHMAGTGVSNKIILDNCRYLTSFHKKMYIRVPVVGGFNANEAEISLIADFLSSLDSPPAAVTLIPYHLLGKEKYELFGIEGLSGEDYRVKPSDMARYRKIMADRNLMLTMNRGTL